MGGPHCGPVGPVIAPHWTDAIEAWVKVREKLSFRQPASYEEVMAMPLQYIVSQRDPRWWEVLGRYGITHVRHFWDEDGRRWRTLGDDQP